MLVRDTPDEASSAKSKVDTLIETMKGAKKARKAIEKEGRKQGKSPKSLKASGVSDDVEDDCRRKSGGKCGQDADQVPAGTPGIDLSVFQPRGKRKCVLDSEDKRAMKRRGWWSDEDDEEDENEDDNEVDTEDRAPRLELLSEVERLGQTLSDKKLKQLRKAANHRGKDSAASERLVSCAETPLRQKCMSAKSYVFSTAMANRAGHFVQKGDFPSIAAYHSAQVWDTPYLNAEIHCRPFIPVLEDQILKEESAFGPVNGARTPVRSPIRSDDTASAIFSGPILEDSKCQQPVVSRSDHRELSVNDVERFRVIQAAKQMARLVSFSSPATFDRDDAVSVARDSAKFRCRSAFPSDSSLSKFERESASSTDSESPPQTVPKSSESYDKDCALNDPKFELDDEHRPDYVYQHVLTVTSPVPDRSYSNEERRTSPPHELHCARKKELHSPPQLVPTFKSNVAPRSYPADVTNIKSQASYSADDQQKEQGETLQRSLERVVTPVRKYHNVDVHEEHASRPSVLNMSFPVMTSSVANNVRSSIDVAEKALKEQRASSYLHHGAESILRQNGHRTTIPLPHATHLSANNAHLQSPMMPALGAHSLPSSGPTYRMSPPTSSVRAMEEARMSAIQKSSSMPVPDLPIRPGLLLSRGFAPVKDWRGEHVNSAHLGSAFTRSASPTRVVTSSSHRPSSLPMQPFQEHPKPIAKSFSVERLTAGDERKMRNPLIDRSLSDRLIPDRAMQERPRVIDPALVPDGLRFKKDLSKQVTDEWASVLHQMPPVLDRPPHDPKLLFDFMYDKETRASANNRLTVPLSEPRVPVRMVPPYLQRPVTNGFSQELCDAPSPAQMHQYLSQMHHHKVNPFTNDSLRFHSR